jgi:hypothetical protein
VASQLRAAIGAAVANQTGWATPDQIAGRIGLPATVMTLHRSLVAGVELAYITREIAADDPGLAAPARIIAMRAQGEAEVAIEQGETRFEGVRWVTPQQIAANQVIPLPEPARRGLINAATEVAAATNQAVGAAADLKPTEPAPRAGAGGGRRVGRAATDREIPFHHPNRGGPPR